MAMSHSLDYGHPVRVRTLSIHVYVSPGEEVQQCDGLELIEVSEGHFQLLTNYGLELRPSSTITRTQNQGEISTLQNRIEVNQSTPQSYDALDVTLTTSRNARLKVNLVFRRQSRLDF